MIEDIQKASKLINSGGTILYPSDTIWGIGCDATNQNAIKRIFQIKQREDQKSMLVLMDGTSMLKHHLEELPEQLIEILSSSDKPTTIIYPGARNLANNLLAEDGSIGIRITSDPFCKELIALTGKPIVSTSANISGEQSPALFTEIDDRILEMVDYVVQWRQDETKPATPSTIMKLDKQGVITILRP